MASRKRANPAQTPASSNKSWLIAGAAVAGLLVVGMVVANLDGAEEVSFTCTPVSGFADVHGLAVAPDNLSRVYAATHHGLMRATNDADWCRVGASQDDYMGFTMHPDNGSVFWVSGHPGTGGNMGVRQSTDGGFSWEFLALEGVDFHAMTVSPADPDRLWGSFRGDIYRSDDGGHDWSVVSPAPQGVRSLAGDPHAAASVYGAGAAGIFQSTDGGENWLRVSDLATTAVALHPTQEGTITAITTQGDVVVSDNGGEDWRSSGFQAPALGHITYAEQDPDILYAASYRGAIYKTEDGGGDWVRIL